jgi:hypothetical protein
MGSPQGTKLTENFPQSFRLDIAFLGFGGPIQDGYFSVVHKPSLSKKNVLFQRQPMISSCYNCDMDDRNYIYDTC